MPRPEPDEDHAPTPDPQVLERERREKAAFKARLQSYMYRVKLYADNWNKRVDFMDARD